jgi:mannitol/fructose-specific phosphotransferase system IIA component (Ntr-type)
MKFSDFVAVEAIRPNIVATSKEGVIREMTQSLVDAGKIASNEMESIVKAIMKREDLGSTGIGRGVAVPHTKHPSVNRLIGTVAISQQGVDFESLDGDPVQLENISRQLRDDTFCKTLKEATGPHDVWRLLEEADAQSIAS